MKRNVAVLVTMIFVLVFVLTTDSFAQRGMRWKGSRDWRTGTQYGKMYDAKTVKTIVGEVVSIDRIIPAKRMSYGVHAMVKTQKETVSVHLKNKGGLPLTITISQRVTPFPPIYLTSIFLVPVSAYAKLD